MAGRPSRLRPWRMLLLSLSTVALLAGIWTVGCRYASQRRLDSMMAQPLSEWYGPARDMANQLSVSPQDPQLQSRIAAALTTQPLRGPRWRNWPRLWQGNPVVRAFSGQKQRCNGPTAVTTPRPQLQCEGRWQKGAWTSLRTALWVVPCW